MQNRAALSAQLHQVDNEAKLQMEKAYYEAVSSYARNFDETDDFRYFIIWLCGYVDRPTPPNAEEWSHLRERVAQVAAKYATDVHDRALQTARRQARMKHR